MYPATGEFEFGVLEHAFDRGHTDRPGCPLNDPQAHGTPSQRLVSRLADLIDAIGVAGPDGLLVVLPDTGTGNLVDERPTFWQPPPNDLVGQEGSQVAGADRGAFSGDDSGQR